MKIAYSCAGEGFGHAARMLVLHKELSRKHRIHCFIPRSIMKFLREKGCIVRKYPIPCFNFIKKADSIQLLKTLVKNIPRILLFPFVVRRLVKILKKEKFDHVLSDFEPYLAWAGRLAGIPVLQINHPGIIARYPDSTLQAWLAICGAKLMEGPWDSRILISFYGGDVGPLLRKSLFYYKVKDTGFILVNVKESCRAGIIEQLDAFPSLRYKLFPDEKENFEKALAECSAVISSAGHQMLAEAAALGKPLFMLPQKNQYEQLLNARIMERSGRGISSSLDTFQKDFCFFLEHLDRYKQAGVAENSEGLCFTDASADLMLKLDSILRPESPLVVYPILPAPVGDEERTG